ncbi:hypothetical protein Z517_12142 [Fonsecaea pedrosoi CBS 271.37]|uniref:Uncharacterized protein n=1 Tax=Fonsecaea pedrosoi CBS 271.37 TaxID=1442368 RepID=A0A0D2EIJ9_9EURO|nr:uncharacterized protein Z517_12142 [Fonsecaea pedrosoi CBS 271.37]KIW74202.1 hypothetical protein Z517_12142 [Fonsecaea pedrosoi CBS 271.37]
MFQSTSALALDRNNDSPVGVHVPDHSLSPIPIKSDNEGSAICNQCTNDPVICCPVECQSDGICPRIAVKNANWLIDGRKITSNSKKH